MMKTMNLRPAPLFVDANEALPLAESLFRAWSYGNDDTVVSPVLCEDDVEWLEIALGVLFTHEAARVRPEGVDGFYLVVSFD